MARHSFIQMSKLSNVKGRISYISDPKRQEYLYATFSTREDMTFWNDLAKECQEEFKRFGTEGKCIEARELIIALPEEYRKRFQVYNRKLTVGWTCCPVSSKRTVTPTYRRSRGRMTTPPPLWSSTTVTWPHGSGKSTEGSSPSRNRLKRRASERSSGIWRRRPNAGMTHGGSKHDPAATIMTEDAKTEKYTAGSPCGAYIGTPCKFEACRASI